MTKKSKGKPSKNSKGKKVVVCIDGATDKGLVRQNNEDAFIIEEIWDGSAVLAVAIDGLGGYEGGEVAALVAKEKIRNYIVNSHNGTFLELLKQAVTTANNAIFEMACADIKFYGMGCVLTAAIIDVKSKQVSMVHVGDTRMYGFHNGKLEKISHDHSQVGRMEELGNLTEEEAMKHPNRNIVDRVLGHRQHLSSDNDFLETLVFNLLPHTTFLLCSDGLTDMITTTAITSILSCKSELKEKTKALIHASLDEGGKDNVTVVLVEYIGEEVKPSSLPKNRQSNKAIDSCTHENTKNQETGDRKHKVTWGFAIAITILGFLIGLFVGYGIANNQMMKEENKQDNNSETRAGVTYMGNESNNASDILGID